DGRRVWDGEEDPEKAQKITLHLLEAFEPGVIRQGARWAGSFGTDAFGRETVGMVVGQRPVVLDLREGVGYRAYERKGELTSAARRLTAALREDAALTDEEIAGLARDLVRSRWAV